MLKACSYCGRIHDGKHICPQKEQSIRARQSHRTEQSKQSRYFHRRLCMALYSGHTLYKIKKYRARYPVLYHSSIGNRTKEL